MPGEGPGFQRLCGRGPVPRGAVVQEDRAQEAAAGRPPKCSRSELHPAEQRPGRQELDFGK